MFLGWITLKNTTRIAANYAASNAVELNSGDPVAVATYNKLVTDDATATNCTPPTPLPPPTYTPNTALGSNATVQVSCSFKVFTPIISVDPRQQRHGLVLRRVPDPQGRHRGRAERAAGPSPRWRIHGQPDRRGGAPDDDFTNTSTGPIVSYAWDFDGDGTTTIRLTRIHHRGSTPVPGTYHPTPDGVERRHAEYRHQDDRHHDASRAGGRLHLQPVVAERAIDRHVHEYLDGQPDDLCLEVRRRHHVESSRARRRRSYPAGTWTVELKVTNAIGTSTTIKTFTVLPPILMCTVPDFKNLQTDVLPSIQSRWQGAGFSTTVIFNPARPPEYKISPKQSPKAGTSQPCLGTVMTVSDK